jgi:hypothetical protein
MLVIRQEQTAAFRQAGLAAFEDEMVGHSKQFAPKICAVIGDEQLRLVVRRAMARADGYGFTNRGPIRLYVEMTFLRGGAFDTDPQYAQVGEALRASAPQMERAQRIHEGAVDYHRRVSGRKNENVHRALERLLAFTGEPFTLTADGLETQMLQELQRIFPEKAAYVGDEALTTLIGASAAKARAYRFPAVRGEALLAALAFGFGHGCTDDLLYPWIARTLKDDKIVDPAARAARLEKKAITWLEHVVAWNREGAET